MSSAPLLAVLAVLAVWAGCAPVDDGADTDGASEVGSELAAPTTTSFQNGVFPTTSYAGTTDASLQQSTRTTNAGSGAVLRVDMDYPNGTGTATNALLRFDLGSIPKGSVVQSVKLTMNVTNPTGGAGYSIYALRRAWDEGSVTWQRASASTGWASAGARGASDRASTALGTLLPPAAGAHTVTLGAAAIAEVQKWIDDPGSNFGFAIDGTSNMDGLELDSSEAAVASRRPRLDVTYAAPAPSGTGLRGEYFAGKGFEKPVIVRTDPRVDFDWGSTAPASGVPADHFSVRWSGQVLPLYSQTYTFTTRSDDGVRLWVSGKLLVDNWTNHAATENSGTISLVAGTKVDIKLEYYEATGGAVAQLSWASQSQPKQIVPAAQLFPATPSVGGTLDGGTVDSGDGGSAACADAKRARAALVPGTYRPSDETTGPLPCVTLRRQDTDLVVNEPNTVIEGVDLYGQLVLGSQATNVVVRHSILRGADPTPSGALVVAGGGPNWDRLGLTIEDSKIDLTGRENWFVDGIAGGNFTIRRSEITRTVDGVGLVSQVGNTLIEANWIHDGYWTTWTDATPEPKPSHKDNQTHNDGIQFHRGRHHVIRGNFIGGVRGTVAGAGDDYTNACLMISQGVDGTAANRLDDVLIEKNWFQGGAASINLYKSNDNDLSGVTIRNNRFLRGPGYYILKGAGVNAPLSNNVFDDTGLPVPIANGG
jgi:hypothetical protein